MIVRHFNPSDEEYEAIAAVYKAAWPDARHFAPQSYRQNDEEWPEEFLNQRFVAEENGRILGMASCAEHYWQHQPGTVHISFTVHPDYAGRGLQEALYETALAFALHERPSTSTLATKTLDDHSERIAFLEQRGYQVVMRSPRSALALEQFEYGRFVPLIAGLAAGGIVIETLARLAASDPAWKKKLYDLRWTIVQDIPAVEPPSKPTPAEFQQMFLDDPAFDAAAWFIAVNEAADGSPWVGMSNLWINDPARKRLDTGLTGVLRPYRRRGIATALKAQTAVYAQRLGADSISTSNAEDNPMVALNLRLGFQPLAAWLSYRKTVGARHFQSALHLACAPWYIAPCQ